MTEPSVFLIPDLALKMSNFGDECHRVLKSQIRTTWQSEPLRPGGVFRSPPETLKKPGITSVQGQAWLVHDLANIELQAAELFLRTLYEYPDAPTDFRAELTDLCLEEVGHLKLCLEALEKLNYKFGDFPIHFNLWDSCSIEDTLIDRIFIVHLYLEASGLDSGEQLLRRLVAVPDTPTNKIVKKIAEDELRHVQFGTHWYKKLVAQKKGDVDLDFSNRLLGMRSRLPRRGSPINEALREKAGFSPFQINCLKDFSKNLF